MILLTSQPSRRYRRIIADRTYRNADVQRVRLSSAPDNHLPNAPPTDTCCDFGATVNVQISLKAATAFLPRPS